MQVAVIGAGAVGCYYGGLLLRAGHDVTFIGRPVHVDAINAHGLLLDTKTFNGRLPAKAATDTTALAAPDLVLVCVKSADTEAGRPRRSPDTCGRKHPFSACRTASTTRRVLPPSSATPSFPSSSMSAARWPGPATSGITAAATSPSAASAASEALAQTLEAAGIRITIADDIDGHAVEQAGHQLRLQRAFCGGRYFLRTDAGSRGRERCRHARGAGSDSGRPCLRRIDAGRSPRSRS